MPILQAGLGHETGSGYLPWLETVAPRRSSESASRFSGTQPEPSFGLAALIHDTRNMITAMELYCDLLEEPGVLVPSFRHYAAELRLVGGAGRRLLECLSRFNRGQETRGQETRHAGQPLASLPDAEASLPEESEPASLARPGRLQFFAEGEPIMSLADELHANQNLLSALAGPAVTVGLDLHGGNRPIAMSREDLTRILINLAKNAAEAMPGGGHIQISLEETSETLSLTVCDNGPGIPATALEAIFSPGYTTHVNLHPERGAGFCSALSTGFNRGSHRGSGHEPDQALDAAENFDGESQLRNASDAWPMQHRGLGLAIVRSIVAAAGGSIWATNRSGGSGAMMILEFPLPASADDSLADAARNAAGDAADDAPHLLVFDPAAATPPFSRRNSS